MLVVEASGIVSEWDIQDPRAIRRTLTLYAGARDAAYLKDGTILTTGADGHLRFWDSNGKSLRVSADKHQGDASSADVANDETLIAIAGRGLTLWDRSGNRIREFASDSGYSGAYQAQFGDAGLFTGNSPGPVKFRALENLETSYVSECGDHYGQLAASKDGRRVAVGGWGGTLRICDNRGKLLHQSDSVYNHPRIRSIAMSPDGKTVATGHDGGWIRLWDSTASPSARPLSVTGDVGDLAFSPRGDILSATSHSVHLFNLDASVASVIPTRGPFEKVFFTDAGELVYSSDHGLRVEDHLGRVVREFRVANRDWAAAFALSPDGRQAAIGRTRAIEIINESGQILHRLDIPAAAENAMVIDLTYLEAPNALIAAHPSGSGIAISHWKLPHTQPVGRFYLPSYNYSNVALSKAGLVAYGGPDGQIEVWNAITRQQLWRATAHNAFTRVRFSPTGGIVTSTGAEDGILRLWTTKGKHVNSFSASNTGLAAMAVSATGERIVTADRFGAVRLWSADGKSIGELLDTPQPSEFGGYRPAQNALIEFAPSGDWMVTKRSGSLIRWNLNGSMRAVLGTTSGALSTGFYDEPRGLWIAEDDFGDLRQVKIDDITEGQTTSSTTTRIRTAYALNRRVSPADTALRRSWALAQAHAVAYTYRQPLEFATRDLDRYLRLVDDTLAFAGHLGGPSTRFSIPEKFTAATISPDGTLAAFGGAGWVRVYEISTLPKVKQEFATRSRVSDLAFSPDLRAIAASTDSGELVLSELANARVRRTRITLDPEAKTELFFSEDGSTLLAAHGGGRLEEFGSRSLQKLAHVDLRVTIQAAGYRGRGRAWAQVGEQQLVLLDEQLQPEVHVIADENGFLARAGAGRYYRTGTIFRTARLLDDKGNEINGRTTASLVLSASEIRRLIRDEPPVVRALRTWTATGIRAYRSMPLPIQAIAAYLFALLALWLVRPGLLAKWAMSNVKAADQSQIPDMALQGLTLARWLGGSSRALDAWLHNEYGNLLPRCFSERPSVKHRTHHVEIQTANEVEAWLQQPPGTADLLWITGPGGCGKTSLACHLARRLMQNGSPRRVRKVPAILPVFIEEDWTSSLSEHVAQRLRVRNRVPPAWMIRNLGHRGRLLLIIDGGSERADGAVDEAVGVFHRGEFAKMMITARTPAPETTDIVEKRVGPLEIGQVEAFINKLYGDTGLARDLLPIVTALSGGAAIRPLFIRVSAIRLEAGERPATTYPQLVQEYVQELSSRASTALRPKEFLRACRTTAFFCTHSNYAPVPVDVRSLYGFLLAQKPPFTRMDGSEVENVSLVLDQLIEAGILQQDHVVGIEHVRFAEDVVAEYLAAMHILAESGLLAVKHLSANVQEQHAGFAEALDRVAEAYVAAVRTPVR